MGGSGNQRPKYGFGPGVQKESQMADDKTFVGGQDRARVEYEVAAFARRHGMSPDEVIEMIERIGNDRDALEREAAKLRRH